MSQHANNMCAQLAYLERRTMSGSPLAHEYLRQLCNSHCEYSPQSGGIGWFLRKSHDESSFFRRALVRVYMQSDDDLDVFWRGRVMPLVRLVTEEECRRTLVSLETGAQRRAYSSLFWSLHKHDELTIKDDNQDERIFTHDMQELALMNYYVRHGESRIEYLLTSPAAMKSKLRFELSSLRTEPKVDCLVTSSYDEATLIQE